MKPILSIKKIFALLLMSAQVLTAAAVPAHAGTNVVLINTDLAMIGDILHHPNLLRKMYNGTAAYCVQPYHALPEKDIYEISDFAAYEKLSEEAKSRIAEFSYFGYGYQGHSEEIDYLAAQYLIWNEVDPYYASNVHFYTTNEGTNIDADVEAVIQRIYRSIDEYHKDVNFTAVKDGVQTSFGMQYTGTGNAGDTIEIEDTNNALANMKISTNEFGENLQCSGSHVTIHLSNATAGDRKVIFQKNDETIGSRPLLLRDPGGDYQTLMVRGDINKYAEIDLHATVNAEIRKTGLNGTSVAGAALKLTDQSTGTIIDAWTSDLSAHIVEGLEADRVYLLEEDGAPAGYYYAESRSFVPADDSSIEIKDDTIVHLLSKTDEDHQFVPGALMEIIDETDGRTMQYTTDSAACDCGSFLMADHTFRIEERQVPAGYYRCQPAEFTVPHNSSGSMQYEMLDARIHYSVVKKDEAGRIVKGAEMALYEMIGGEKKLVTSWTSGLEPKKIGSFLQAGHSYCIAENNVSTKYFLAVDQYFTVSEYAEEGEHEIAVTDHHIHYELEKIDENGTAVKDARLLITDITDPLDDARVVLDWHSTEEPLVVNMFERGHTYRLQEIEGPDGYYQSADKIFKVPDYGTSEPIVISCEDDHVVYKFMKTDENSQPVIGAELTIYEKNSEGETAVRTFVTDGSPEVVYGLKSSTDYVIKETKTPAGYYPTEDISFHVNREGDAAPFEITMKDQRIQAVLCKTDEQGTRIADAVLAIADRQSGRTVGTWTTASDQDIEIGSLLTAGHTYTVKEISAPAGYYKAAEKDFSIPASAEDAAEQRIAVEDQPIQMQIQKTDADNKPLPGAELTLYMDNESIIKWISTEEPFDISKYLTAGSAYVIKETKAPDGYYYSEPIQFTVAEADGDDRLITVKDLPIHYEIHKTDEKGNTVTGVQLRLWHDAAGGPKLVREWTTSSENEKFNQELTAGQKYILEEGKEAAGYHKAETISFTIPEHGNASPSVISMIDEANEIAFLKTDENGQPLPGAEMEVIDLQGNVMASFMSGEAETGTLLDHAGQKIGSLLFSGETYVLHEVSAPFGYDLCQDVSFQMTGTVAKPQTVLAADHAKTIYLKVDKRGIEENMPLLSDCEITVFNAESNKAALSLSGGTARGVTDENGTVEFQLPYTNDGYYVKETKAPQGYAIDSNPKEIRLSEESFNSAAPQEIHVVDHKSVNTGSDLPYHAFMALLCAAACFLLMKWPHEKA
jgi:uncharacterized surface anchored protein